MLPSKKASLQRRLKSERDKGNEDTRQLFLSLSSQTVSYCTLGSCYFCADEGLYAKYPGLPVYAYFALPFYPGT